MEDKKKKGSYKKKGAAESDYLSEAGDVAAETAQKNEGAPPRKKGSAKEKDPNDYGISPLSGKPYAKSVSDEQKAKDKAKADAMKKGSAKKDMMMDEKPVARKKGSAKKKGAAGFNSHTSDTHKHPHAEGPSRMGFTQNFGAARQNSYAKGAARVASIMSFGASKKKGAADAGDPAGHKHPHSEIKLDNIAPSGGVKTNYGKQSIRDLIKSQGEYDANTTQVSQNLAELDSLKMVASGNPGKAKDLYSDKQGPYNSNRALVNNPEEIFVMNNSVQNRIANKKKLIKEAKVIQGPRPTL